jgi:hypothetical protein
MIPNNGQMMIPDTTFPAVRSKEFGIQAHLVCNPSDNNAWNLFLVSRRITQETQALQEDSEPQARDISPNSLDNFKLFDIQGKVGNQVIFGYLRAQNWIVHRSSPAANFRESEEPEVLRATNMP